MSGDDHDTLFRRGTELIDPHMILDDRERPALDAKSVRVGIACLDKVLVINSGNWPAWWIRGKAFQTLGDSAAAIESFQRAYALETETPDVGRELAASLMDAGRNAEALQVSREVSERRPDDAGLKANLALALVLNAKVAEAKAVIEDALRLAPTDTITAALKARIDEVAAGKRLQPKTLAELQRP